ncbi:fimbria/pilus periplasmic chaperone [Burkholderia diffusa]|uniref:fimbria/pilus periplasmic chaperone n=1 Tax=Burkholderia diffusa TaxID=488732 RepID=UPI0009BD3734|nr:fimbria/pilus periplasmic chaperone [Burkholderia diffusa]
MKSSFKRVLAVAASLVILSLVSVSSMASVVVAGTRVIFDEGESEVTIKLSNQGQAPALVQTWIDDGNKSISPENVSPPPFTVTPPVARIDPGKGQTLRILYTGDPLPKDKESVFWLNVVEIPPKPSGDLVDINYLQLAFRSRFKLFFRPAGLEGKASDAPGKVVWKLKDVGNHSGLEAVNPTPYHISVASLRVSSNGKSACFTDGGMIDPGATKVFPLVGGIPVGAAARLHYQIINDYGGSTEGDVDIGPASPSS